MEACGARTAFWPDDEACDAECFHPPHPGVVHEDEILGTWDEDSMFTVHPKAACAEGAHRVLEFGAPRTTVLGEA